MVNIYDGRCMNGPNTKEQDRKGTSIMKWLDVRSVTKDGVDECVQVVSLATSYCLSVACSE